VEAAVHDLEGFLRELSDREFEPLLANVAGSIRFDVANGDPVEPWRVAVDHGRVSVSRDPGEADCQVRAERSLLDDLACGRANAMAAVLRGALGCGGNLDLLLAFQRVFPSPPRHETGAGQ
jgi:hypothetical protein